MTLNLKHQLDQLKLLQLTKMSFDDIRYCANVEFSDNEINNINRYLCNFVKKGLDNCLFCGSKSFKWSIINGVAECADCGWECVVLHIIKDQDENIILQLNMPLQYHPDVYEIING